MIMRKGGDDAVTILDVVRDLMLGGRHSRRTLARMGVSLATADRYLQAIAAKVPGVQLVRIGKVSWYEIRGKHER